MTKPKFSKIAIIYNPKSTGQSQQMAKNLRQELKGYFEDIEIVMRPTKYAGHAQKMARQIARDEAAPLIISSSGDGGYNEVVNGVMQAGNQKVICAVLPAGNANDHRRTMRQGPLGKQIKKQKIMSIDLIKMTQASTVRYAHSYVGLGLTPAVAVELNRHSLNAFKELFILLKVFYVYKPFKIKHAGKVLRLDSLLFANTNQMAKVLKLAPRNRPADGKLEMIAFPASPKWRLIKRLAKATFKQIDNPHQIKTYKFRTLNKMPLQMDGEVTKMPSNSLVTIEVAPQVLKTVV